MVRKPELFAYACQIERNTDCQHLHQPKEQTLKMLPITGAVKTRFNVNLHLNDILQLVCSKKVQKRPLSLRKQRLHLELSFASLLIVNVTVNLNSKTEPLKGHPKQVQIKSFWGMTDFCYFIFRKCFLCTKSFLDLF